MTARYVVRQGANRSGNPYWYIVDTRTKIPFSKRHRSERSAQLSASKLNEGQER